MPSWGRETNASSARDHWVEVKDITYENPFSHIGPTRLFALVRAKRSIWDELEIMGTVEPPSSGAGYNRTPVLLG